MSASPPEVTLEDESRQFAAAGVAGEAEAALHGLHAQLAAVVIDDLLQHIDGVAHAARGAPRDQLQSLTRTGYLLLLTHICQPVDGRLQRYATKIEALATRADGCRYLMRFRCRQDEDDVRRRLFQRLLCSASTPQW
jgi:hypothetical protein